MNFPENVKYSNDHEWIRVKGDMAFVGISDYAQSELGEIVYVDVTTVGETLQAGEVFGSIEAVKTVSDLMMPVSGKILELNADLDATPELVNSDPYGKGWIVKIEITRPDEIDSLLSADQYKQLLGK